MCTRPSLTPYVQHTRTLTYIHARTWIHTHTYMNALTLTLTLTHANSHTPLFQGCVFWVNKRLRDASASLAVAEQG